MGIDLQLLLDPYIDTVPGSIYPHVILPLNRDRDMWDKIEQLETQRLNRAVWMPEDDEGLVERTDDPYGNPLRFVTAKELAGVLRDNVGDADYEWRNRATLAYLEECPPLTPIILWWH